MREEEGEGRVCVEGGVAVGGGGDGDGEERGIPGVGFEVGMAAAIGFGSVTVVRGWGFEA